MRLRFAPSPTGYLHVGGLRTALFNYLLARQTGGSLILRIEDTDQSRKVDGAVENLIESLEWAGLDYDEGPLKDGGKGPYFQSQRLELYRQHVDQLVAAGHAYPCFCSTERLDELRKDQESRNLRTQYDGLCRQLDPEAAQRRMDSEPFVIRMKVPRHGELVIHDLVRGDVHYPLDQVEDQVLLKSDGFPTYHLANVVDDHHMGVDTVVRGEEWLPSTPKHILLYQYFEWELPAFAHLPLLLNADRSKLSKRQGDVAVEDYREKGFMPSALINFVALLGWNPGDDQELMSMDELIQRFSLERVNKAGAVFDLEKLTWMNGQHVRGLNDSDYLEICREQLQGVEISDAGLLAVKTNLETWLDLPRAIEVFVSERAVPENDTAQEMLATEPSRQVFRAFLASMPAGDRFSGDDFKVVMKSVQQSTGVKGKQLWMPVRIALTGQQHGPELTTVIDVFGAEKIRSRISAALGE